MVSEAEAEKKTFLAKNKPPSIPLTATFSIEKLRFFGFVALIVMLLVGQILTMKYVFIPDAQFDERMLRGGSAEESNYPTYNFFGMDHPYLDRTSVRIFEIFGFLHSCSYVDHNPAKVVASMMLPLFSFPMSLYLIIAHYRIKCSVKNEESPVWLYYYSMFATAFGVFAMQQTHLWFVNSPDMKYPDGVGFVGHYLPYALFQLSLVLTAYVQVNYIIALDEKYGNRIPFGLPRWIARWYARFSLIITLICQLCVWTMVLPQFKPILDSANGEPWERFVFKALSNVYLVVVIACPTLLSFLEVRSGKDTNTFTLELQ